MNVPSGLENLGKGLDNSAYRNLLRRTILGNKPPEETILLEVLPLQQKTLIDFALTEAMLGIPVVCVSELKQSGRQLYFERHGKKRPVSRIYNRVIFEDLERCGRNWATRSTCGRTSMWNGRPTPTGITGSANTCCRTSAAPLRPLLVPG